LSQLFRRLLDASLEFAFGLLKIGLLGHTTREQREPRSDEREHGWTAP
jgi:hypothetical protein